VGEVAIATDSTNYLDRYGLVMSTAKFVADRCTLAGRAQLAIVRWLVSGWAAEGLGGHVPKTRRRGPRRVQQMETRFRRAEREKRDQASENRLTESE